MARTLKIAGLQAAFGSDMTANIATVSELIRYAAGQGAQVILPPELFQGRAEAALDGVDGKPFFCHGRVAAQPRAEKRV